LRPHGLTYVPYFILLLLDAESRRRPSDLATALRLDTSSLTGHLDRLVDQGYVERRPDSDDRRVTRVSATPAGHALLADLQPLGSALSVLDPDLSGLGRDATSEAERALPEIHDAVRQVGEAFQRVDRAASAGVDALGALTQRARRPHAAIRPVLRVATMTAADAGGGRTLLRFAQLVRERTADAVGVETIIPYRDRGGELNLLVDVRAGRLALIGVTAAVAGTLVPLSQALELPYLFENCEHARRVLDGPLGQDVLAKIDAHGLLGLGIASNGVRSITTRDIAVRTPADMRGLRLRTQQAPVNVYFAESLGAIAVPLPYERLSDALRNGDVDAQENALANIVDLEMWREQHNLTLTEHTQSCLVLIGNPDAFADLGSQRGLVEEALRDAIAETAAAGAEHEREALALLEPHLSVIRLTSQERAAFISQTQLAHDRMARALGDDVLARLTTAVNASRHSPLLAR
jgi:TRAP-type C4-dicarboxylate transport system substrate-binding protein/DNA-binding MarR family transcriptional regulator